MLGIIVASRLTNWYKRYCRRDSIIGRFKKLVDVNSLSLYIGIYGCLRLTETLGHAVSNYRDEPENRVHRPVQTDFQQIGETQFLITVNDADNINHIVVFLTGSVPFSEGMGGAVYFSWPDPNAPPNWQFLGYISNVKPSAIFKISTLKRNHEFENSNLGIFGIGKISHVAQIGVSVEPLPIIEQQAIEVAASTTNNFVEFTQSMVTSFLNYITSFSVTQSQMTPNPTENFVPLSSVQSWYERFERRLQQNPNFWRV